MASLSVCLPLSVTVSHSISLLSNQFDKHSHRYCTSPCALGKKRCTGSCPGGALGVLSLPLVLPTPLCILTSSALLAQELQGLLLKAKKRIHIPATSGCMSSFCAPGFQFQQQKCCHFPGWSVAANAPGCPRGPKPCCLTILGPGRPGLRPSV